MSISKTKRNQARRKAQNRHDNQRHLETHGVCPHVPDKKQWSTAVLDTTDHGSIGQKIGGVYCFRCISDRIADELTRPNGKFSPVTLAYRVDFSRCSHSARLNAFTRDGSASSHTYCPVCISSAATRLANKYGHVPRVRLLLDHWRKLYGPPTQREVELDAEDLKQSEDTAAFVNGLHAEYLNA